MAPAKERFKAPSLLCEAVRVMVCQEFASFAEFPSAKVGGSHIVHEVSLFTTDWPVRHQSNLEAGLHRPTRLGRAQVDLRAKDSECLVAKGADPLLLHLAVKSSRFARVRRASGDLPVRRSHLNQTAQGASQSHLVRCPTAGLPKLRAAHKELDDLRARIELMRG